MAPSTNPISISLRPPIYPQPAETDLNLLISRMDRQMNGFRHVTTANLESQIAEKESQMDTSGDIADEEEEDVEEESDVKGTLEFVAKNKASMAQKVSVAVEEASMLLDCVSLLQTSFAPKVARETLSPWFKSNLPNATVEYDKWLDVPKDQAQTSDDETISRGWKLRKLADSADALLGAAKRLEEDVRHETNYWSRVLAIESSGNWPVFPHPKQKHLIGVRVASMEAGSNFRVRGTGLIKMDGDGDVYLDLPKVQDSNRLRVRIERQGKIIGSWIMDSKTEDGSNLEQQAALARDTLFDEELLFEMQEEARSLLSLGVKSRDGVAIIPGASQLEQTDDGTFFMVDVIDERAHDQEEDVTTTEPEMNKLAHSCALSLRLLLFHNHHQRYLRRSAIQPPAVEKRRHDFEVSIIKPLMKSLYHYSAVRHLDDLFKKTVAMFTSAGILVEYKYLDNMTNQGIQSIPFVAQMKLLTPPPDTTNKPQSSTFHLSLPSATLDPLAASIKDDAWLESWASTRRLSVHVFTQFSPSNHGTSYAIELPNQLADVFLNKSKGDSLLTSRVEYRTRNKLCTALFQCLSLDITIFYLAEILNGEGAWAPVPSQSTLIKSQGRGEDAAQSRIKAEVTSTGPEAQTVNMGAGYFGSYGGEPDRMFWNSKTSGSGSQSLRDVVMNWATMHHE